MVYFPLLPPVRVNIKRMMEERLELYHHVPLQDSPIPVEFNPFYAAESLPGGGGIFWRRSSAYTWNAQ